MKILKTKCPIQVRIPLLLLAAVGGSISAEAKPEQLKLVILGPKGSGKSTLINWLLHVSKNELTPDLNDRILGGRRRALTAFQEVLDTAQSSPEHEESILRVFKLTDKLDIVIRTKDFLRKVCQETVKLDPRLRRFLPGHSQESATDGTLAASINDAVTNEGWSESNMAYSLTMYDSQGLQALNVNLAKDRTRLRERIDAGEKGINFTDKEKIMAAFDLLRSESEFNAILFVIQITSLEDGPDTQAVQAKLRAQSQIILNLLRSQKLAPDQIFVALTYSSESRLVEDRDKDFLARLIFNETELPVSRDKIFLFENRFTCLSESTLEEMPEMALLISNNMDPNSREIPINALAQALDMSSDDMAGFASAVISRPYFLQENLREAAWLLNAASKKRASASTIISALLDLADPAAKELPRRKLKCFSLGLWSMARFRDLYKERHNRGHADGRLLWGVSISGNQDLDIEHEVIPHPRGIQFLVLDRSGKTLYRNILDSWQYQHGNNENVRESLEADFLAVLSEVEEAWTAGRIFIITTGDAIGNLMADMPSVKLRLEEDFRVKQLCQRHVIEGKHVDPNFPDLGEGPHDVNHGRYAYLFVATKTFGDHSQPIIRLVDHVAANCAESYIEAELDLPECKMTQPLITKVERGSLFEENEKLREDSNIHTSSAYQD